METMKRRSILQFALLNIVTFGIWGIVEGYKVGQDIDRLCEGDGETEVSYVKAWLLGIITLGIYMDYWWYKQANRLKLNAGRYNLRVRESGLSLAAFRAWGSSLKILLNLAPLLITIASWVSAALINPFGYSGYGMGSSFGMYSMFGGNLILGLLRFISMITPAWSIMGYVGLSFLFKNLNRFADVYETYQPRDFDLMGYGYYDAERNFPKGKCPDEDSGSRNKVVGHMKGISGTNAGYSFDLKDSEEIIIGRDPSIASVIIAPQYKAIGRKHCGIIYRADVNEYQIIDYSVNGTYVNGKRLPVNVKRNYSPGVEVVLAETDNRFRLE